MAPSLVDDGLREFNAGGWNVKPLDEIPRCSTTCRALPDTPSVRLMGNRGWTKQRGSTPSSNKLGVWGTCVALVRHYDPTKAIVSLLTKQPVAGWSSLASYLPGSITILNKAADTWHLG
jgi:broad specificity phosphatase PhoE